MVKTDPKSGSIFSSTFNGIILVVEKNFFHRTIHKENIFYILYPRMLCAGDSDAKILRFQKHASIFLIRVVMATQDKKCGKHHHHH